MSGPQAPGPPGGPERPAARGPGPAAGPAADPASGPDPGPGPGRGSGSGPGSGAGAGESAGGFDHKVLKSLLGAWALAACSAEETAAVEAHLTDCAPCADEALRLRDAVGLLHTEDSLDLDPMLRSRVLEGCLGRRPARIPVPGWAAPYDAETARLDALLRDMAEEEWRAPVRLRWFDGEREAGRETTVAGVIGHLLAVDGMVATALGLPDPLPPGTASAGTGPGPMARTEVFWALDAAHHTPAAREPWRAQNHAMIRHVSFAADAERGDGPEPFTRPGTFPDPRAFTSPGGRTGPGAFAGSGTPARSEPFAARQISYGDFTLPLHDAFLDRAFECWMHAEDIAEAVDYPYGPPDPGHLNQLVDLTARQLPGTIAARRRTGLAPPPRRLGAAGAPGRTLHLEVEGLGGGDWYIPLDSPGARASPEGKVAHVAMDGLEFCQLAAGHVPPLEAAAGQDGDREAIRDVLFAVASLSRL